MIGTILRIRYELIQEMGEGPIFKSYRARDRVSGREVCVRLIQPPFSGEPGFLQKLREIQASHATLYHAGVERLLDVDEDEGVPFLVSEFLPGHTLEERIRRLAPFSAPVAVEMAVAMGEALAHLHTAGVIHGDVNPVNVVVSAEGSLKLALAGIWRAFSSSRTAGAVMLPQMAPYLAPEISAGAMPHPGSDVYALGIILYELLTGRHPFPGETPVSVGMKHATQPLPSLRALNSAIPVVLEEIVKKATEKDPLNRYEDAKALLADLRTLQDAMRFGKALSWPIRGPMEHEPAAVAPKMGAVRQEPKKEPKARKSGPDVSDKLPIWLSALVYTAVAVLFLTIGGYVFLNANKTKPVPVPNIVGMSLKDAAARLKDMNLKLKISGRQPSEKVPEDAVIQTVPAVGRQVKENSVVWAVVSAGSKFVEVPDLRGRTVDDARTLLSALSLEVAEPIVPIKDRHVEAGKIISQLPEPRRKVERGSRVRIKVSSGNRKPTDDFVPDDYTQNEYSVKITLPEGSESILVRVDMTDAKETRTIYEEEHQPGEVIEITEQGYGSEATFRIFFDGDIVKQVTKQAESSASDASADEPPLDEPKAKSSRRSKGREN